MGGDKRFFRRFRVQDGTFADVKSHYVTIGPIIDISVKGLAFHYIDSGHRISNQAEMNIWAANRLCLADVCFTVASDLALRARHEKAPMDLKRCGVKFRKMSPAQKSELKSFISNHGKM